jgi:polyisoprenoid-binding protein YceI
MKRLIFTLALLASIGMLFGQARYHAANTSVTVEGTSTFHDWHMTSEAGVSNVAFTLNGLSLVSMPSLIFTVPVETLKSGTKGLNNNAYKALKSGDYPNITFNSSNVAIRPYGTNSYIMSVQGKLIIANVTKDAWISVVCKINPDNMSIEASGSCKLKMTDYQVDPPSFMFGAMKTGDEITIKFSTVLNK